MCDCVEKVNANLKPHNTVLSEISMLNMMSGTSRQSLKIATEKLHRKRSKVKVVIPTFCPFCGEKIRVTSSKKTKQLSDTHRPEGGR
jgi:hypothetical protein